MGIILQNATVGRWRLDIIDIMHTPKKQQQTTREQGIIGYVIHNDAQSNIRLYQSENYFPTLPTVLNATMHSSIQSCWCVLEI